MDIHSIYLSDLKELNQKGRERSFTNLKQDKAFVIDDNGHRMLNLSGNDYLGIGARGEFIEDIIGELNSGKIRMGTYSSRLLTGNSNAYEELEELLKNKFSKEAALIFNSGYHMNTGIIPALATSNTIILADKLVHASIIDGIILSKCKFERFRHNDLNHLERLIIKHKESFTDIIVAVESVYSMDGDTADLQALVRLKEQYPQIRLYVDEAHAIGVRGKTGLGLAEETNTIEHIDLLVGTFGKAIASVGGYLVTDNITRRYLIQKCRPLIFSTAIPPINIEFSRLVLKNLHKYNHERDTLKNISKMFIEEIKLLGFEVKSSSNIIPIVLGEDKKAKELSEILRNNGFFVLPIRPPSVPEGSSRLRISLTSETTDIANVSKIIAEYIKAQ